MMDKILLAEDDINQLKFYTAALKKYSDKFEVIPVRDGKEAIDVLKQEPVALVVTDIHMPRVNGMVLLAYVHTYHPDIPCIVMTAYGTSRLKYKLPQDLLKFFQKPFEVDDLAHAILAALKPDDSRKYIQGIHLLSFLNLIEMEESTCVFKIASPDKPTGALYFQNGILYDAESGDLRSEAAAIELISRKKATYGFKHLPEKEVPRTITTELQELIRNAIGSIFDDEGT